MDNDIIKLITLDLDGTLTQHRSLLEEQNRRVLDNLGEEYKLLILGAGDCRRIHHQMGNYPIDIIGNYGMEKSRYNPRTKEVDIIQSTRVKPNRKSVLFRAEKIRKTYGYTYITGESIEFHPSGMVTFPLLGTGAPIKEKLEFDPTREKRRAIYSQVEAAFPEYTVFIGGSSSYDMAPAPYNKLYAIDQYCKDQGLDHRNVIFFGDDWTPGGGDRQMYTSDIRFVIVDDYKNFKQQASFLLSNKL